MVVFGRFCGLKMVHFATFTQRLLKNGNYILKPYNLSKKMTKAEIVSEIAKSTGIDKASVLETLEKFMETVKDSLANGQNVYLRGFGSFIVKTRSQKTARNILKNTSIIIPEHNIPAFKPAKVFMEQVK